MIRKTPVIRIAMVHLLTKKRQTIVAMLGVTFGVAMFIFQAGLMSGFQSTFIEETVNTTANIRIFNEAEKDRPSVLDKFDPDTNRLHFVSNQKPKEEEIKIRNGYQIMKQIEKHPSVAGVSPFLGSQVIYKLGIAQVSGRVSGVDIIRENVLFKVEEKLESGGIRRLQTIQNGIILGAGLSEKLGARLNDNLFITSPLGVTLEMKVVGIHRSGLTEADNTRAFINIRNAQKLLKVDGSYITDINIKLKNVDEAERLASEFQSKYGYRAQDWKSANANIFGIFRIQNMITYLVISSILVVSGFGIFNILMMIIFEKMPDIAILKAIGYKDKDIRRIFMIESMVIGVLGGLLGLLLGFVLQKIVGSIRMNISGFVTMEYLKFNSSPVFFIFAYCFALAATALAGYIPARKAAKVDPIDIIRSK